jgi:hypothetical protein
MAEGLKDTQSRENRNTKIPTFIDSEESMPIVRCMQVEFIYGRRGPVHNLHAPLPGRSVVEWDPRPLTEFHGLYDTRKQSRPDNVSGRGSRERSLRPKDHCEQTIRAAVFIEGRCGMAKIRAVVVEGDREHGYKRVQVLFGINYFLEITEDGDRVSFLLGSHHEAFKAEASEAKGELEKYIKEIMERHPESVFEED